MNEIKYSDSIRILIRIIDMYNEIDLLYEDNPNLSSKKLKARENAIMECIRKTMHEAKPAITRDILDALKNAPRITPEEIDLLIPHVNTPKTIEKFTDIAENGLPGLNGLWLLTEYQSCEFDYGGPEVIVDDAFGKGMQMERMDLHCAISDLFFYDWVQNRLSDDVIRERDEEFHILIVREILAGRVRALYIAKGAD